MFEDMSITRGEAATYIDWGEEGNYVIQSCVDNSSMGALWDWEVTSSEIITDCKIGLDASIKLMAAVKKSKMDRVLKKLDVKLYKDAIQSWISPSGKIHLVRGFHIDVADDILYDMDILYGEGKWSEDDSGAECLEGMGWIRMQNWEGKVGQHMYCKTITSDQARFLSNFCRVHDYKFEEIIYSAEFNCSIAEVGEKIKTYGFSNKYINYDKTKNF